MAECQIEQNRQGCNCSYEPCAKKGMCCACLRSHWQQGQLPACLFPNDVEKTYDRSVEKFIKTYQKRGRWW